MSRPDTDFWRPIGCSPCRQALRALVCFSWALRFGQAKNVNKSRTSPIPARFVRGIFTGVYASDFGLWNTNCGSVAHHRQAIGAENVRLLFNIVPEAARYLADREIVDIARSTVFNSCPDGLCVSGLTAGMQTDDKILKKVKDAVPGMPVFVNTGVRLENVEEQLGIADGAIVGTTFKHDGLFENHVDKKRVKSFMDKVKAIRKAS